MSKSALLMLSSLILVGLLVWVMVKSESSPSPTLGPAAATTSSESSSNSAADQSTPKNSELTVFCAASNQAVMEQVAKDYERQTGRRVALQYGTSQALLTQSEVAGVGDLFLPADDSFLTVAREKNLVAEVLPLAKMACGLAVRKGNPKGIRSLSQLLEMDLRLVQANPDGAAVAKLTRRVLREDGQWDKLDKATDAYRATVTEVAQDVQLDAADVGIVYDAVLHSYPELEFVTVPELASAVSQVSLGVLKSSKQPTVALHFARFVAARDRGLKVYREHGFQVVDGDVWKDAPELTLYAGSMLRPAIDETIVAFEQREGVRVNRVYNGCGILVAQMKSGQRPDAYFACDVEFMSQVADLFPSPVNVSENELVILVPKGNPNKIASLRDLTKPGLKVGVGHEKQCAMGWITQNTFRESGLQTELMANVTVQTPTGDMLVNQLRAGSLDAAVAYLSNAAGSADFLDAVQITGIPCSIATQPWAVATESQYPQLMNRLFEAICSAQSQEIFTAEGFRWNLKSDRVKAAIKK